MMKVYWIVFLAFCVCIVGCYERTPYYGTPHQLMTYAFRGDVNTSIDTFFDERFVDATYEEWFLEDRGYGVEDLRKNMKETMGTRFNDIRYFYWTEETIDGNMAVVKYEIAFDDHDVFKDYTFFVFAEGRWWFDFANEMELSEEAEGLLQKKGRKINDFNRGS